MTFIEKAISIQAMLVLSLIIGWIINIFQIVGDFTTLGEAGVEMILRLIGIFFFPLGSIMGLFVW